jgi:hypothetical protein
MLYSQEQDERIVEDPQLFREFLDQQIEANPELFPPEIRRGHRMKDLDTSRKTGWKLRRIDCRDDRSYLVRPSLLDAGSDRMHRGRAGPHFLRKFAVPARAVTEVFGRNPMDLASPGALAGAIPPGGDHRQGPRMVATPPGRR